MSRKIVVTGTGPVGLSAALDLSIKGFETVLVGDKRYYSRDDLYSTGELDFIDLEDLLDDTDIEFIDEEVEAYRPREKIVETSEDDITYDNLVVSERGSIERSGLGLDYTDNFYSPEARKKALDNIKDGEVAVIGAGLEGTKIGTFLQSNGYETALIDKSTRPLKDESEKVSQRFLNFFNKTDLSFRGGTEIKEITSYGLEFKNGKELEIDNIIWAGDLSAPETVIKAFECGKNGIKVNKGLSASGYESVYAGGESADTEKTGFYGKINQGRLIAENISKNSELLEKYSSKSNKLLKTGEYGSLIKNDKAYIYKALTYLIKSRKIRHRFLLKLKTFRA